MLQEAYGSDLEVTECLPSIQQQGPDRIHASWVLKGYRGKERWRGVVDGVGLPDDSGRGRLRRLDAAVVALGEQQEALRLPRPLGSLRPLSMIAFVRPEGKPLEQLLGTADEGWALERLAKALASFHALRLDVGKERSTGRDVASAQRRLERIAEARHPASPAARELLETLQPPLSRIGERRSLTVDGLHLRHLRLTPEGVGASLLDDVVMAEPLLTAGELFSQLQFRALKGGASGSAAASAAATYLEASGSAEHEFAVFAALHLLRRACRRGARNACDELVEPLLASARDRLEALGCR